MVSCRHAHLRYYYLDLKVMVQIHKDFLSGISTQGTSWLWPTYEAWLGREDFCQQDVHSPTPFWWKMLPSNTMAHYRSAAFIEWRYFSVISPAFHGICGVSLFNPEKHLSSISEGGLIALVAGGVDDAASTLRKTGSIKVGEELDRVKEFCFMHVFPTESLKFYGPNKEHLHASHNGVELRIEMHEVQKAEVYLEVVDKLSVRLQHRAVYGCPLLKPVTATDFLTVPGAHWTVDNPSPVAIADGTIVLHPGFLDMAESAPSSHSNFISLPLAEKVKKDSVEILIESAAGYYEHSFGVNPMPVHGWDFLFVPSPENKTGLVLQTYRGSAQVSYLEVLWAEGDGVWKTLHIPIDQCRFEWAEATWHPKMRVYVPRKRIIHGEKDGYEIQISNSILTEIPFVRDTSTAFRHFFISEEISYTSWTLKDQQGKVVVNVVDALSGGETGRGRWYYNMDKLLYRGKPKTF